MKKTITNMLLTIFSVVFSLGLIELVLRLAGFSPNYQVAHANNLNLFTYDSILGWDNVPGEYVFPPYDPSENKEVYFTINRSKSRRTSEIPEADLAHRPKMIFSGGSFTQGWAISDWETFPWKVQQQRDSFEVLNYGINGYGTYQSLLLLERQLRTTKNVSTVNYVMITHHIDRNVAPPSWANSLSNYSASGSVQIPYVSLDNEGAIVRHPPLAYTRVPFSHTFAFLRLIEKNLLNYKKSYSEEEKQAILLMLINQMKKLSDAHGASFQVIGLGLTDEVVNLLKENEIAIVACPYDDSEEMRVKGEGHPNEKMNAIWASYILESM